MRNPQTIDSEAVNDILREAAIHATEAASSLMDLPGPHRDALADAINELLRVSDELRAYLPG